MKIVGGYISYYELEDWWFSSFTDEEREYIDNQFNPLGSSPHTLTTGTFLKINLPAPEFLNSLNSWFKRSKDMSISNRIHSKLIEISIEHPIEKPGYYLGRHFTTWVRDLKILKKKKEYSKLEDLLKNLVKATEDQNVEDGLGVAPYYYHELAILYRKQKEYSKEVFILNRFSKQKHGPGVIPAKLLDRLNKAKSIEIKMKMIRKDK